MLQELVTFIQSHDGIYDKAALTKLVSDRFCCVQDRSVYSTKSYPEYHTETDIKTKIVVLTSSPKGYNTDKILGFLSDGNSVFMIYFVGVDYFQKSINTKLISMFHNSLIDNTIIQAHWAGRNSRGVSQFNGEAVKRIILNENNTIDIPKAQAFLERLVAM